MSKQIEGVMALVDEFALKTDAYQNKEVTREELFAARHAVIAKLRELLPVWHPIESCLDDDWVIVWLPADEAQVIAQRSEGNWFGDDGLLHEDPALWMPLQNNPAT